MTYEILAGFAFAFGTVVGSFLNVCIYRLPKNESITFPGSHCCACGKPVRWYDNIPVLSYFLLRGKCRDCGAGFSVQYALIELLTGVLFLFFYHLFGFSGLGVIYLVFTLALLVQSMIDFEHKIIPDAITLPGIILGFVFSGFFPALQNAADWKGGLWASLIGILAGGGVLYLIAIVAEKILKKEAMGGGDVKLLAMVGAFLGFRAAVWTLFVGSVIGSVAGVYFKLKKSDDEIPFGPFLGLAAFLYLFFGEKVIHWYLTASEFSLYP